MTKAQAMLVKVGDKAWSRVTGLGALFKIEAIDLTGPRAPYFLMGGRRITYRDVTPKSHRREPALVKSARAARDAQRARERYWTAKDATDERGKMG